MGRSSYDGANDMKKCGSNVGYWWWFYVPFFKKKIFRGYVFFKKIYDHSRLFIFVFAPVVGWTSIGTQTTCGSVAWDSDTRQADIITNKLSVASTTCGYCRYCFKNMGHLHNIGTHLCRLSDCTDGQFSPVPWHHWSWHIDLTGSAGWDFSHHQHTWRFYRAICSKHTR